ncbi:MAG: response regulator [Candidatus Scalindua sp.]|jgi:signal transduction histidine kinase|nr:response regulator [Candidatus Scalindua sp.]MBT5305152.1 response regulator [Candidatus Scalindua sp.]MBT6045825.1 response regulator [Candidatus Scalindua sp.]MBT6231694.1 response regulator [Candidatus Scalindua sp.]MBT6561261.1 response regulator [Candidatus Scalindua sp.]
MSKTKILIVEDELITAKAIRRSLNRLGYDVLDNVASGEEAIQIISKVRPDLILMDIILDGKMDGIETASEIKNRFNIPLVYLTAHADNATLERAKITEPYSYILKPFEERELHIAIEIAFYKHKMEESLLQSEKLKSLGVITAGVAHEFNNILAVIMGNAELLNRVKDDKKLETGLNAIIKASDDGAQIVKRMITYAKAGGSTSNYLLTDINYLIREVIDFTMPRWKNIAQSEGLYNYLDTEGMKEIPEVFCNPTELREVFVNLINNSLDAMPDGGRISFSTESDENTVFVSISDTGKGMPEDVKKKIFDPFFTTRSPLGTGLGMSCVYSIIKSHGGKIEVESEVGKGTTINLNIPHRKDAVQRITPSEPDGKITTRKLRILVIDDNEELCVVIDKFLTRGGHTVETFNNGAEAIELAREKDVDLVLCDLAMSGVTGYDVVKELNKFARKPKIGVITGWSEKLKLFDEEGMKVDFILRKPLKNSELTKQINSVFSDKIK